MSGERNMVVLRRAVEEIWNQGNLDLADDLFAPTYVNHGGLIPDVVIGSEAIKIAVLLYRTAFPGLYIEVEAQVAEGEIVELRWAAHGTPRDASTASARVGQRRMLTGTTLSRLTDGRIMESWTVWDTGGALQRLGILRPRVLPYARPDKNRCC